MKLFKGLGIALCVAAFCFLVAPNTKANEQSTSNVVTFAVPVEVPGLSAQTLPAGTYLFKALDSSPSRDVIQVSSPDGTHVFTTFLAVPNFRLNAPDLITVMFTNRPAADPVALKAWYYPGRKWGDEIVYEKARAAKLAKESNEPVLSTSVVFANSTVDVLKTAVIEAVNPAGETVAIAQVVDAPPVAAPALNAAMEPAATSTPNPTEGSTVAVATSPKVESVIPTGGTVVAEPAAAIDTPATSTPPAATDPAAASAPTPIEEPSASPAPVVAAEPAAAPVVAVAPVAPVEPPVTAQPVTTAAPPVNVEPAEAPVTEVATATLPKTASLLPLIGLVGLLMLGAGFLLTSLMKRRA